jgi:hypothetical protein
MAKKVSNPENRLENVLAYMAVGVIATSILSIAIVLITYYVAPETNLPVLLRLLPLIGLPLGMLLIITLVIVSARRRAREAK